MTAASADSGFAHYLRDMVYGALDGVITTLAVIAGASGAELQPRVGLILGLANLVADGISMGASNYLGIKSEIEQRRGSVARGRPLRHGLATAVAFVIVGSAPLLAFVVPRPSGLSVLAMAAIWGGGALFVAGALRAHFVGKSAPRSAIEMLAVGTAAGGAAYAVGAAATRFIS